MKPLAVALASLVGLAATSQAHAQYNAAAGRSAPMAAAPVKQADGSIQWQQTNQRPAADSFGNPQGNQYDLAVDGAFDGETVAVLHFYTGEGFDFALPRAALREKGFSTYRWSNAAPSPADLRAGLARANQLWVISGSTQLLRPEHLQIIKDFFDAGHGVYILGDNAPYFADANAVSRALLDASMDGDVPGDKVVGLRRSEGGVGLLQDHLITTGLEHLYEGITIATVHPNASLTPLLYGSAGNLVSAFYDHDRRRAIVDGGFTRLYMHWDTAGTARYVKNAAAWLANVERFGERKHPPPTPAQATPPTQDVAPTQPSAPPPVLAPQSPKTSTRSDETPGRRLPLTPFAGLAALVGLAFTVKKLRA
jgi:hypothetical protein